MYSLSRMKRFVPVNIDYFINNSRINIAELQCVVKPTNKTRAIKIYCGGCIVSFERKQET